jgi:cytochrome c biogenesis protein CcdA
MVPVRIHAKFLLLLLGILVVLFSIFAMIQTSPEAGLLWLFSGMLIVMGCAVYAAVRTRSTELNKNVRDPGEHIERCGTAGP